MQAYANWNASTEAAGNLTEREKGSFCFLIIVISYNARYAKHREVKNLYFPESGLFPRPADLQPSVIPYDSTFAFFIFLCLISILVLQSFYGLTNYKAAQSAASMRACILFFQILFLCCYKFCGHSDLFIFLWTTICSYDFKSLARSQLIIPLFIFI